MFSQNSSCADSLLSGEYEVFLSFCGQDTRNGFTDFLYTYLQGAGVRTFMDNNELRVGEEIGSELLKAIENSKISIPIFSKNYASSKWCLLELTHMVECYVEAQGEKMIFPIFYDVNPHDVRHQTGSYEKAFRIHEKKKRLEVEMVRNWREALTKVGQMKGLELEKETGGREGELVKITVEKVLQFLRKNYSNVPKNLVGMDNNIEKLMRLLKLESNDVRIVGIHGMGGLGKTTIAKVIYNQLCECFESHCFLENIRENSKHCHGIVNLQNQLLSGLQKREVLKFPNVYEGSNRIKDAVRGRKSLIVLDDVDEIFQIDMLMGHHSWFGAWSRIIVTTRDKNVLDAIEMICESEDILDVYKSFSPKFMGYHHSLQLFCKYAFMRDSPLKGYEILSKEVVSIAAGLPLVLVVLGSTFSIVKDKDIWEEKLKKLRVVPHKELLEKLRLSFEVLEYRQKQIFLDIACLFTGMDKTIPCYMWDDCGFYPRDGISVLISRSLITIGDDNILIMHDQLRDLGRQIVREENPNELGKWSRLWCEKEAMHILETCQGTSNVNALCLPYEESPRCLDAQHFRNLPYLRYLIMWQQDLDGDFIHVFSNLRWLKWRCSGKFRPTNLHLVNLVILDLSWSNFSKDWECWSQIEVAMKLKVLHLSACFELTEVPCLSTFKFLEILKLDFCTSLCKLDGLQQLRYLKHLDASYCEDLEKLPSLSNLTKLVELHLLGCEKLIEIHGLEELESLQVLDIGECSSLETLWDFSALRQLKTFKASGCNKLIKIEGLHRLNSLKVFHGLELKITGIRGLGRLESLEDLHLSCHKSVERLPSLSNLQKLKKLRIYSCENVVEIHGLDRLEFLEDFDISFCRSIQKLPDLPKFRMLKVIKVECCKKLHEVEVVGVIVTLESLDISNCVELPEIPDLRSLKNLRKLRICFLNELLRISGLEELTSLESLDIRGCQSIEALPDFSNLQKLTELDISNCRKVTMISGLEELKSLKILRVNGCEGLRNLPDLPNTTIEQDPTFHDYWSESFDRAELTVNGCEGLKNLPDLPNTIIEQDPISNVNWEWWMSLPDFGYED